MTKIRSVKKPRIRNQANRSHKPVSAKVWEARCMDVMKNYHDIRTQLWLSIEEAKHLHATLTDLLRTCTRAGFNSTWDAYRIAYHTLAMPLQKVGV